MPYLNTRQIPRMNSINCLVAFNTEGKKKYGFHISSNNNVSIVSTIRVEPSLFLFLAFISKSVNNQCYNPYISGKIFSRAFQKCIGCSIVNRFRDNSKKRQHRRLNSYRGDYTTELPIFFRKLLLPY